MKVAENDYQQLFNDQMKERRLFRYPPSYRLIRVVLKYKDRERLDQGAGLLAAALRKLFGGNVLGPEYPVISRIQNWYQKEIWIKLERNSKLAQNKTQIMEAILQIKSRPHSGGLVIYPDVDPM